LEQRTIDLDWPCAEDEPESYGDMVDHFESIYANDAVAILPSAYILRSENSMTEDFEWNVFRYPLSSNLSEFIRILRDRLPTYYIGVHLRFRDDAEYSKNEEHRFKCSEDRTEVLDMIRRHHMSMIEKDEATSNSTPSVFIASNSHEALRCYKQSLKDKGIQAFSLSDLIAQEKNLVEILSAINAPKSIIYLSLDQVLVSLGQRIVLLNMRVGNDGGNGKNTASTFHWVIEARHEEPDIN
jgi:hypothetical protein